jgi:outer membrane protein OmpA-like peptidoglycan-associated protein
MNAQPVVAMLSFLALAVPAGAQDLSPAIRLTAACGPVGAVAPADAPRLRRLDSESKTLYNAGEQIAVNAGTSHGVEVGRRFFVRRAMRLEGPQRAEQTVGWVSIVDASATSAVARIDFTCDAVAVGDHLEPYVEPALPPGIDVTDATGTLDFTKSTTVLVGVDRRQLAGGHDFMLASVGQDRGATPGARYAVYHGTKSSSAPQDAIGEAVVVSVFADTSLLRITGARDVVSAGDRLVPRVGGAAASLREGSGADRAGAAVAASAPPARTPAERVAANVREARTAPRESMPRVTFEDLHFGFDRSTLKDEMLPALDRVVATLKEDSRLRIAIEGYSCNVGSAEYNRKLGERRAAFVKDYLVANGVDASRVTTVSYGEEQPKHDNGREETRRLNRRAALTVDVRQ